MVKAPPFPGAWGYDQLIGQNKTNIINASIEAWKNTGKGINQTTGLALDAAETGMGAAIMFGMIPFVLGTMVYVRTQKLVPTTFTMLLSTVLLHQFRLIQGPFLYALYIITVFSFTFSMLYAMWNKE